MKSAIIWIRNTVIHLFYRVILKPVFFMVDPEDIHDWFIKVGKFLGKYSITRFKTKLLFSFSNKKLNQNVLGINFVNPVGLAAGFDKDAKILDILPFVGFGFAEVGSITAKPSKGNAKPRLWRLPKSKGLVVYYGLKNNGAEEISNRLKNKKFKIPFGTSIAMTNCKDNMDTNLAISDYKKSFEIFSNIGDYFTINISCPNIEGGQPFMNPEKLENLLVELDKSETKKPIFVKISPDISFSEMDIILEILKKHRVDGIICGNLTKKKDNPLVVEPLPSVGGISGLPVRHMADALISHIYKKEGKRFVIIGCGGIFNAEDAYKKIRLGATLLQLITGMIFEGPQVISEINYGLVKLLERDGYKNISEAVGVDSV